MNELLDAPPTQTQNTGDLKALLDATAQGPQSDPSFKAESSAPVTPDTAIAVEKQPEAKPKAKAAPKAPENAPKPEKGKSKWQGLEALKSPENEQEQAPTEESKPENQEQTQKEGQQDDQPLTRWKELRATEDKYKEIAPAYEALQKRVQELESKPQVPKEMTEELERFRQMYAVETLDSKPEFQQEVLAPMQEQLNGLASVAAHAGLDAVQKRALREAAENPDTFMRIRSIKQILGASTAIEDPDEIQTLVQFALDASGKYQEAKKREAAYVGRASEMANAVRGKEAQQSQAQIQAKQAEYETAHKEMLGTLKAPLKALFDDPEFGPQLTESIEAIRPAESPMDQAYQAQAGELLPYTVKMINKLKTDLATAQKALKAREAAKPKTTDGTTPVAEQGQQPQDLRHLLNSMARA